jgi:uridine kinase
MKANEPVDQCLIDLLFKLISTGHRPCIIGIAGQTAAGKTEIVARLQKEFLKNNLSFTSIEMDHFLTDRDDREAKGIDSLGKEAMHFNLFKTSLKHIRDGQNITIPIYDFISATSSHTLEGILKPDSKTAEVQSADIIFVEGNFPFLYDEIAELIDIKVVYITDDEIRLKRKWKRDMDLRKKYDLTYFINRYFREQFLMAESAYIPQMEKCDVLVDTTEASIWVRTKIRQILEAENLLAEPDKP